MAAYYNEFDPYAAEWLRNLIQKGLIADGAVDERDIRQVRAEDLRGFRQVHFFAGIGGWSLALRLAGWPDDRAVWTGSCPCQPFSVAGSRRGFDDDRHLWPVWQHLIAQRRPATVFGEQVATASDWLALVRSDLEKMGYAVGAMPIEAASVGALHKRDRYWFVAHSDSAELRQQPRRGGWTNGKGQILPRDNGAASHVAHADSLPRHQRGAGYATEGARGWNADRSGGGKNVANTGRARLQVSQREALFGAWRRQEGRAIAERGWWAIEPAVGRVADGVPCRVGRLRAYGNAIVPQVAATFILAASKAIRASRPPRLGA